MTANLDFNENCRFPAVVLYHSGDMSVYDTCDPFVTCRRIDVKAGQRGRFARATVVDSCERSWGIDGATILHGVGPFWGYNILMSRTVRVRPNTCSPPAAADLDWVKREVVERLSKEGKAITVDFRGFCATIERGEALRTLRKVEGATSVPEVLTRLLAMDFPERASLP
jgi:hypothetical protein